MPVYKSDLHPGLQAFLQLVQLLKAILQRSQLQFAMCDHSRGYVMQLDTATQNEISKMQTTHRACVSWLIAVEFGLDY